ncbi:MAG: pilin [bacterium]|nr:pilin [bacterium]
MLIPCSLFFVLAAPLAARADEGENKDRKCLIQDRSVGNTSVRASVPSPTCKARFESESKDRPLFFTNASCYCCGNCGLPDVTVGVVQVSKFLFGISGSLALLMFTIGGIIWVTSEGNTSKITKGKQTLIHAALGMLIVFGAWVLVNTILLALTGQLGKGGAATVFDGSWAVDWSTQEQKTE